MAVTRIGSWASATDNTASGPTHTHTAPAGSNRVLLAGVTCENPVPGTLPRIVGLRYGGILMAHLGTVPAVDTGTQTTTDIFLLQEAGIALAADNTFDFEWADENDIPQSSIIGTAFRAGVSQRQPVRDMAAGTDLISGTAEVSIDRAIEVLDGDLAFYIAAAASSGDAHSPAAGYTEGYDEASGHRGAGADDLISADGTTQPEATFGTGSNAKGIFAIVVAADGAVPPPAWSLEVDSDDDDTWNAPEDDLTANVDIEEGVSFDRGGSVTGRVVTPSAGTLKADLFNDGGDYDVGSDVSANKPVRLHATFAGTEHDMWQSRIENMAQNPYLADERTTLTANGPLSRIVNAGDGYSTQLYTSITTDVAIGHCLDAIGFPAGKRTLDTGTVTLSRFLLVPSDDVWSVVQQILAIEGPHARLYDGKTGNVVFEANDYRASGVGASTQETFRTFAAAQPWVSAVTDHDRGRERIVNTISFPRKSLVTAPASIVPVGETSQQALGPEAETLGASDLSLPAIEGLAAYDVLIQTVRHTGNLTLAAAPGWTELGDTDFGDGSDQAIYWRRLADGEQNDPHVIDTSGFSAAGDTGSDTAAAPGTGSNETRSGAGANWNTATGIETASDVGYAEVSLNTSQYTGWLQAVDWGLTIPDDAVIVGIEATYRFDENSAGNDWAVNEVRPVKGGVIGASNFATVPGNIAVFGFTDYTAGGATELGGETWTPADIMAADFGIAISAVHGATAGAEYLRCSQVAIEVFYRRASVVHSVVAYRGVIKTGTPWDDEDNVTRTADNSPAITTLTVNGLNRRAVVVLTTEGDGPTVPSGYTLQQSLEDTGGQSNIYVADKPLTSTSNEAPEWTGMSGSPDSWLWGASLIPETASMWSYGEDLVLGAGETAVLPVQAAGDAPFVNLITPVLGDDYTISAGGLASGPTLDRDNGGAAGLTVTATGSGCTLRGPTDGPTLGIRVRGDAYVVQQESPSQASDATSQAAYGEQSTGLVPWPYVSAATGQTVVDSYLAAGKDLRQMLTAHIPFSVAGTTCKACLEREIGERIRVDVGDIDVTGWVERLSVDVGVNGHGTMAITIIETTSGGF